MNAWVRYVDGRFLLTWQVADNFGGGPDPDVCFRHRPLTRREVLLWRLLRRTPNP